MTKYLSLKTVTRIKVENDKFPED